MRYENPQADERVNYTEEHPLKEFGQLLLGIAVVVILVTVVLNYTAGYFAARIPFGYEQKLLGDFSLFTEEGHSQQKKLQSLADKILPAMDLPEAMSITVHYDDGDTINAFATLGGHVVFYQGLLDEIKSEQELAAVMAHEIAHIKHRHPIVALGKGATLAILGGFIGGASGSSVGEWVIGSSANLSLMQFSREQERHADASAAQALYRVYGHIGGADELFKKFLSLESRHFDTSAGLELFRSHPYSEQRWGALRELAQANGWPTAGSLTSGNYALPE